MVISDWIRSWWVGGKKVEGDCRGDGEFIMQIDLFLCELFFN